MNNPEATKLDLAHAARLVASALDAAQINADERARLACAKALLRLEPPSAELVRPEAFASVLEDIGRG